MHKTSSLVKNANYRTDIHNDLLKIEKRLYKNMEDCI